MSKNTNTKKFFVPIIVVISIIPLVDFCASYIAEYNKELREAKVSASVGYIESMDAHLTLARWAAEERGIDISERVKAIRSKGWKEASYDAFEDALRCAHGGYIGRMNDNLEDYRALCLKIGMEPDEVKIREIEEIAERISIENTLSSGPPQIQKTVIKAKEEVLEK